MDRGRTVVGGLAVAVMVLSAGCAGLGSGSSGSEISVHGVVFSDHFVDLPCAEQAADEYRPEELSGIELTFSDGDANVLGTATTGPLEWEPADYHYGCRFLAAYAVTLPKVPLYRVEFNPPPPRELGGGYFEGAELLEPQQISYETLQKSGFEWSFEAEPAYVVP